jgi:hypothetical protein
MKLTNIELNVLAVALDHMEEHLIDIHTDFFVDEKLKAVKSLQTKLL